MGFWGSFVVARTGGSLLDLVTVVERSEGLDDQTRHGPWRVGLFPVPDLADVDEDFHADLARETGAPVLTAYVLDSDTAVVEGYHEPAGYWRACLARESAFGYWDDPDDFRTLFLPAPAAAEHAVDWALAGGLQPDAAQLYRLFALDHPDPFAEDLVTELVLHLGVPAAGAAPAATTTGTTGGAAPRAVRRRHPLDALVHEHVAPVLAAAGFRRVGRRFRLRTPAGDDAVLSVDAGTTYKDDIVAFRLTGLVTPAAWRERWFGDEADPDPDGFTPRGAALTLPVPRDLPDRRMVHLPGMDDWELDPGDAAGLAALERTLREHAPRLAALADPLALLDADEARTSDADLRLAGLPFTPVDRLMFLLDRGPTRQLADAWAQCLDVALFDEEFQAWAQARLADRFGAAPGWRDGPFPDDRPGSPRARLAGLAREHLAPALASAGFTERDGTFRLRNDLGDQLLVEPVTAWSALGGDLVFSVLASVVPAMELRWQHRHPAASGPTPGAPSARDGWCLRRIAPPPEHARHRDPALPGPDQLLGLDHLWHSPRPQDDAACGAALAAAVTGALPQLRGWLDRDVLLGLTAVTRPARPGLPRPLHEVRQEIVLLLDTRPDLARALLDDAEAQPHTRDVLGEFLDWARGLLPDRPDAGR